MLNLHTFARMVSVERAEPRSMVSEASLLRGMNHQFDRYLGRLASDEQIRHLCGEGDPRFTTDLEWWSNAHTRTPLANAVRETFQIASPGTDALTDTQLIGKLVSWSYFGEVAAELHRTRYIDRSPALMTCSPVCAATAKAFRVAERDLQRLPTLVGDFMHHLLDTELFRASVATNAIELGHSWREVSLVSNGATALRLPQAEKICDVDD